TDCLTSIRSTTTSITQSTSAILSKSSAKLPSVTRFWVASVKNGAGFIFVAALKAPSAMLFGGPSLPISAGVTSRRRTWRPAWAVRSGPVRATRACWPGGRLWGRGSGMWRVEVRALGRVEVRRSRGHTPTRSCECAGGGGGAADDERVGLVGARGGADRLGVG